jgi:hypothetical protein
MNRSVSIAASLACVLFLTSCTTRSISDSGYREEYGYYGRPSGSVAYQGELSEWDILGTGHTDSGATYEPVKLKEGDRVLVIQSGAFFPDDGMIQELQAHLTVVMFSGVPPKERAPTLGEQLRSAALNGGCGKLLVYWGVLEAAQRDQVTKSVSWVPVVGQFVPDSTQSMRIRVKAVVVDASSGRWSMFLADSFEEQRLSAPLVRESSDQGQVARLKAQAYHNLLTKLL